MAPRTRIIGREALTRRLNQLAPNVRAATEIAKLQVAKEAARLIAENAPGDGDYANSIEGGYLRDRPRETLIGIRPTRDPDATGVYGSFIWHFIEFGTARHSLAKGASVKRGKKQNVGPYMRAIAARPHVFPTWRAYRKKAVAKIRRALNKAVLEARRRRTGR